MVIFTKNARHLIRKLKRLKKPSVKLINGWQTSIENIVTTKTPIKILGLLWTWRTNMRYLYHSM